MPPGGCGRHGIQISHCAATLAQQCAAWILIDNDPVNGAVQVEKPGVSHYDSLRGVAGDLIQGVQVCLSFLIASIGQGVNIGRGKMVHTTAVKSHDFRLTISI